MRHNFLSGFLCGLGLEDSVANRRVMAIPAIRSVRLQEMDRNSDARGLSSLDLDTLPTLQGALTKAPYLCFYTKTEGGRKVSIPEEERPTPKEPQKYFVFLSSPTDVENEREIVKKFFKQQNQIWEGRGVEFECETGDIAPISAGNPIDTIKSILKEREESYLLYIGIMGTRFGSPTKNYLSGTHAEFEDASEKNQKKGYPEIAFFFKDIKKANIAFSEDEDIKQYSEVLSFRQKISEDFTWGAFGSPEDLQELLHAKVARWLQENVPSQYEPNKSKVKIKVPRIKDIQNSALVQNAPVLLCFVDPDESRKNKGIWEFTEINENAWEEILGYPNKDKIIDRIQDLDAYAHKTGTATDLGLLHLIHPDDRKDTKEQMDKLTKHRETQRGFLNRYLHNDNSYGWISWFSNLITEEKEQEERTLIYSAGVDITEHHIKSKLYRNMKSVRSTGYKLAEQLSEILEEIIEYDVFFLNSHHTSEEISGDDNIVMPSRRYRGPKELKKDREGKHIELGRTSDSLFDDEVTDQPRLARRLEDLIGREDIKNNASLQILDNNFPSLLYVPIYSSSFVFNLCLLRSQERHKFDEQHAELIPKLELGAYLNALQRKRLSEPMRKVLQLL